MAGVIGFKAWTPAFAGVTTPERRNRRLRNALGRLAQAQAAVIAVRTQSRPFAFALYSA